MNLDYWAKREQNGDIWTSMDFIEQIKHLLWNWDSIQMKRKGK
jgi:hypothetical protein